MFATTSGSSTERPRTRAWFSATTARGPAARWNAATPAQWNSIRPVCVGSFAPSQATVANTRYAIRSRAGLGRLRIAHARSSRATCPVRRAAARTEMIAAAHTAHPRPSTSNPIDNKA